MRELLFRGKSIDAGEWVEGYYQKRHGSNGKFRHFIFWSKSQTDYGYVEVDPKTLCQYTGLNDKNGQRIWENDIVSCEHEKYKELKEYEFGQFFEEPVKYIRNYKVEFVNTGFSYGYPLRNKSIHFMITGSVIDNHNVKVIGNIFDNKELLGR